MGNKNSGRRPKPVNLEEVEKLASLGISVLQIAHFFDMTEKSLYRKAEKAPEIMMAINKGRSKGVIQVAAKLYEKIQQGDTKAIMFYLRAKGGFNDTLRVDHTSSDGSFGERKNPIANYRELLNEFCSDTE